MSLSAQKDFFFKGIILLFIFQATILPVLGADVKNEELNLFFDENELIESTTRYPTFLYQVPENVTIITKEQILAMNAHSLSEVLNRVAGLTVDFNSRDFASDASIQIHNSLYEQVVILLDGRRFNKVAAGINYTATIPVQIIERIEVIRDAASSSWGSALGGVINIITKDPEKNGQLKGMVSGSYGESSSSDLRTELSGTTGRFGYYLSGGQQQSNGIMEGYDYENQYLFTKLTTELPHQTTLTLTAGTSDPDGVEIHSSSWDWHEIKEDKASYLMLDLYSSINEKLSFSLGYSKLDNDLQITDSFISNSTNFSNALYEQLSEEINGQLAWSPDNQTIVLGMDYQQAEQTDHELLTGTVLPTTTEENWAIYLNDTISVNNFTVTPGIRYDNHSISNDIISPSFGVTYFIKPTVLLRALVARGFTRPAMNYILQSYDYYGYNPNPDLKHEKTWTYQTGIETLLMDFFHCKATLFLHDTNDMWAFNEDELTYENKGNIIRKGFELEVRSQPWHNFSVDTNITYVYEDPDDDEGDPFYNGNLTFLYNNNRTSAQLSGHYTWYNKYSLVEGVGNSNGTTIWDCTLTHNLGMHHNISTDFFFNIHNLFNGSQYRLEVYPNAPRWVELGVRLRF